jgi:hypothetical protein
MVDRTASDEGLRRVPSELAGDADIGGLAAVEDQ